MNQIMPVGRGVVIAIEREIPMDRFEAVSVAWEERFGPDIPLFLVSEAQIVLLPDDKHILFEFTGTNLSETFVGEFQRWWELVNG